MAMEPEFEQMVCEKPSWAHPDGRTGTHAGYEAHRREGEEACEDCRVGHAAYIRHHAQLRRELELAENDPAPAPKPKPKPKPKRKGWTGADIAARNRAQWLATRRIEAETPPPDPDDWAAQARERAVDAF